MKKIKMFYLQGCPYCKNAFKAIEELVGENPEYKGIEIEKVEETEGEAEASKYDYYYVPTMFIGDEKVYEASPSQDFDSIKASVKGAFDKALSN